MTETRPGSSLPGPNRPLGGPSLQKHAYRKALTPYLLVAPAIAIVVGVLIYPMFNVVWTSLWDWDFRHPEERTFVGLANYADVVLRDRSFRESIRFTAIFTVVSAAIEIVVAVATAMAIHRTKRWAGIFATVMIMPFMLAQIATGFMWRLLFNLESGLVNWFLGLFGVEPTSWAHRVHKRTGGRNCRRSVAVHALRYAHRFSGPENCSYGSRGSRTKLRCHRMASLPECSVATGHSSINGGLDLSGDFQATSLRHRGGAH